MEKGIKLQNLNLKEKVKLFKIFLIFKFYLLVSTYVVCERLSVMHQQARLPKHMLPEIFDQILQNTPVLGFGSRTPPHPKIEI